MKNVDYDLDNLEIQCRDEKVHEEKTDEQKVHDAIAHVDPNLVLRNLAFWLDVAMAKGRFIDLMQQQAAESNGVSTPDYNSESEV